MAFKDYSKDIANARKNKKEEKSSTTSSSYKDYSADIDKYRSSKVIGFDTLESDLASLSDRIRTVYNGWQTRETMENTRSSVQSMYDRLGKLQEYNKKYGGADVSETYNALKSVLDDWDGISKQYGQYKNAEAYNKALETFKKSEETKEGMKTADLGVVQKEVTDLEAILETAKKYNDKAIDYSKQSMNIRNPSAVDGFSKTLKKLTDERDAYLKSVGYESMEALEKAVGDKKLYYSNAKELQDTIARETKEKEMAYSQDANIGWQEWMKYVSERAKTKEENKPSSFAQFGLDMQYVDNPIGRLLDFKREDTSYQEPQDDWTQEERNIFGAYFLENPDSAYDYAAKLNNSKALAVKEEGKKKYSDSATSGFWEGAGHTALSILSSPLHLIDYFDDFTDVASGRRTIVEEGAVTPLDYSSAVTGGISEKLNYDFGTLDESIPIIGGKGLGDAYGLGTGVVQSAVSAYTLGRYGTLISYFGQGAASAVDDALARGADAKSALLYGTIVGAAEGASEMIGVDNLLKIGSSSTMKELFINVLKQSGAEGIEEGFSSTAEKIADNFVMGDKSKFNTKVDELVMGGMSVDKAKNKAWIESVEEIAFDTLGGAVSGGFHAGPVSAIKTAQQHSYNKNMGQTIKSNERVDDMFDIASTSPEVSSAYEAYSRYANKGINAENISDAKLGNLYSSVKADAKETLESKKSTEEQKTEALKTLTRLSTVVTENTVKKEAKAEFNVGEETKVTDSGVEVDVKDLKIKGDEVTFATEKGDVSVDDVTLTQKDAELVLLAKGIAKTDGEEMANLFISQYDGTTSAEEYANSFNLTMAYAKNDYTYETILNKKRSLSTEQVNAIYAETRIKADRERQNKIDELNKKMADKMSYKGYIDDSAIDEATWNKLDSRQKQAITFIKGIAQATGMNLVLTHNPESKIGGSYEVDGNTITIDVARFKNDAGKVMETIIPTMSHETTHWMEQKSPELWRRMNELVFSTLQEADGLSEVDRISIEMKKLKAKGRKGTEKEARSEIIARACEDMLSMSEQGKKIFNSLSESEQKTLKEKIKEIIQNLKDWVSEFLGAYKSNSYEAKVMRKYEEKLNELSKLWDEMFAESVVANQSLEKSGAFSKEVTSIGATELSDLSEAVGTDGEKLFQYRAMVEDENIYREMLLEHKDIIGISNEQINALFDTIDKAVDIISQNLEALDYAWDVDVDDRAFSPVKPNSDSLYKVSLDFSTLCRKRLLQQTIQQTLQNALDKNLSKEESIAIRDELIKIQEEGRQIEVACALCYVESARMKSPAQINKFLNNREAIIKEFFANRSGGSIKEKIAKAEEKARKELKKANPDGLVGKNGVVLDALTAPKSKMSKADADYIRAEGKKAKASYKLTEHEQAELDIAKGMSVDDFTSAKGLENLARHHKDLFDAYTSFVRNATHSKGIENDTWWRAGDSDAIGETLIAQMNAENGLRSQSWSDFQVIHLLDYIAATIELSTKGAKRQSYTKVPDYVKLLGNTGDMINMSLIPERVFEGKLSYDGVEGMAYDIAKQLRDEYHETVGTICIGINNEQIRMLLADSTIDMVIPYHHSSMSKAVRKLMHIPAWESYQNWQNEKKLSDTEAKANAKKYGVKLNKENNYQVTPKFSEWFDIDEARQIAKLENANPSNKEAYKKYGKMYGGYMAMQNAANNYLKLCAERGIAPKFSSKEADFTQDANYWKLLIDRKMVDNVTGEIIEQKPIKPIFNEQHILEILNDELARYPQVKADQEYATRKVTEKFLSGEMDVDKSTLDAIKKPIDNITEVNILESARDGVLNSDRYEVIDIPFDMYSTMEKHFGTTKNFDVAGYMLRDGTMLDFSGKHWGDTTSNYRQVDHRDIQEVLNDDHNGVQAMVSMISNGNIRLMPEVGGINLANEPNGLQVPVLRDYINHFKGEVTIDIDAIGGDTIHSFEYSKGTSASKILADLEGYFRKGEIPTRTKSNLAEFLYSDREDISVYDILGETDRILAENEKLKADINRLNERLKIERKITKGNYFNANQLGAVAGHLRNISNSTIDKVELMKGLKEVYSYIAQSPDMIADELIEKCYRIADAIIEKSKPEVIVDDYYKTILKDIKNTRISFSESQKKEAQNIFDKNWNRYFFGNVIITDKGIGLESKWQEWASQYPGVFDAEISDGDMVGELYRVISTLREASETVVEYNEEERKAWLVNEIYNQYWNLSPIKTTADKYNERIKQLNIEHRKAMKELRDDYNARLEAQRLADDIHYGKKVSDVSKKTAKVEEKRKADREKFQKLYRAIRDRKDKEIAMAKQHGRERMEKYKENAERKTIVQRITANSLSLNELLVKNSKDKHVPEIMKGPVTSLLQAIDFSSKRLIDKGEPTQKDISLSKALGKVKDMMVKATNAHEELVELYGHGLDEEIESMVDSVDNIMRTVGDNEFVLNKMSVADLQTLDKVVKTIRHAVNKLNEFHIVNHAKGIANLSRESVSYLDSLGKGKIYDGIRGKAKKLLNWNNALPYYVFKRYGSGGMKVYEALQDGWDKFAFNVKKIIDYANNTYTSKEVKEWSKEVKTFKIQIPASDKYQEVQMTVPQIMSMYCLNKREQARGHLFQGGIRVADFKDKKGEIVSQSDGVIFTEKDIQDIFSSLTKRQKEVAEKLQQFMNDDCAEWGNEVSMARFGYKAFGEPNYFPIQSDKNNLAVNDETEQPNSLFKLLNMSFTKSTTDNANNRIVISDIFDVFAQHTSDMAKYNALALSVLDSFKWYNFTEKEDVADGTFKTSGVKQSIERAFGKDGQSYFTTFLIDINGSQEVSRDTFGRGFFSNAKIAAVGANIRVMALQPTSYVRASAVIDNKYLTKALVHKPKINKAEEHCGIALWKSLGYYDTNIQRGVEAQIKHDDTVKDKAVEWSMKGAEIADKVTWGYLWNACELEIRDKRKDLKVGSEEFYTAIGKRLREVIYATQVVDSTMTRSQMMRSTDLRDKMLTAFASEPTLSYNMIQDAFIELSLDTRRMGKNEAWKKNGKKIARVLTAYTMTNALAALVESAFDAFRDDDDEEMDMATFMKLYLGNFASDMSVTAKIPYIKEVHSIIKGFTSSRSDTQWMEEITKAVTTWYKIFAEGKGKPATAIKYSIKGISDLSGLPFYNAYRDIMALLNKLDIFTAEDLNEMFGDYSD